MANNDLNFLDDLLPSSVIKVITVETLGGQIELETNPHIVEETVPVYIRAEIQSTLGVEAGASLEKLINDAGSSLSSFAAAYGGTSALASAASAAGFESSNKETTYVTLDCSIRDTLDADDTAAQWFMSQDITQYLYITMAQFTSKKAVTAYKKLLETTTGPGLTLAMGYLAGTVSKSALLSAKPPVPGVGNLVKASADIKMDKYSVQDIVNEIDSSTTGETISEQDLMLAGFVTIDDDGNTVYDFPAKFGFEINSATPTHVAYYVSTLLDIEKLLEDNNLTTTSANLNSGQYGTNGEWVSVITSGELNLNDGRISDFRDVDDVVPSYSVDLSEVDMLSELASGTAQNFTTLPMYRHKHFSDIHLTPNSSLECGYFFGFSFLDFMKDNSMYGRFFDNVADDIRDEVLRNCTMQEIKILRRRVHHYTQGSQARGFPNTYEPFDETQVDHVVVSSNANKRTGKIYPYKRMITNKSTNTGAKKTKSGKVLSGGIREVSITTNATNGKDMRIRHFTGKDSEVKRKTDGLYQYGVEITVRDYVPVYIGNKLKLLRQHIATLKEYEVFANIPVVNRYKQTYSDPHVRNRFVDQQSGKAAATVDIVGGVSSATSTESTTTQRGHYDPSTNKFTSEFLSFAASKYQRTRPWARAPIAFAELLDLVVSDKMTKAAKIKMAKNLTSICNPESGTPRGISAVISLFEQYIKIVEDLVSSQPPTSNSSAASSPNTRGASSGVTDRTVTYKTYFNNAVFNADEPPYTGMSFLNMSNTGQSTSIGLVSTSDYAIRAKKEVLKYFDGPTSIFDMSSAYSMLSVSSMNTLLKGNSADLSSLKIDVVDADGSHGSDYSYAMTIYKNIVQYVASKRKADQTKVLTIDSTQRIGQSIAPEFGVTLMTEEEATNLLSGEASEITGLSAGGDDGTTTASSKSSLVLGTMSIAGFTAEEADELDFGEIFPSAMVTSAWDGLTEGDTIIDVLTNLTAGYEKNDETEFLTNMLITSKRDYLHSTKKHPADPSVPNFDTTTVLTYVVEQLISTGASSMADVAKVLALFPPSVQAAVLAAVDTDAIQDSLVGKTGEEYWNHPVYNILYQLYFMTNVRVEYLEGYRNSNMSPKYEKTIGAEIWLPVTKKIVTQLNKKEGQQILCRIRPYSFELLRIGFPKALAMPIWNSKFILVGNNGKPLRSMMRKIGMTKPQTQVIREGLYTD